MRRIDRGRELDRDVAGKDRVGRELPGVLLGSIATPAGAPALALPIISPSWKGGGLKDVRTGRFYRFPTFPRVLRDSPQDVHDWHRAAILDHRP